MYSLLYPDARIFERGLYHFQWNTEPTIQLQVGNKKFPEREIDSSAESYYQLRKALGSHQPGSSYAVNIDDRQYRSIKYILAFDCEKQTNVGFSGLNTRTGDLISIFINKLQRRNINDFPVAGTRPDFIHTTLEYDAILSISDSGVTVLE